MPGKKSACVLHLTQLLRSCTETQPKLNVSSKRYEEPRVKPQPLVYKESGLTTRPQRLLSGFSVHLRRN